MFRSSFPKVSVILLLTAALVPFGVTSAKTPMKADWKDGKYAVVEVVDGDTVKVRIGKKVESIRILGIDTPEKYPTRTGYAECYGDEASAYAVAAFSGKTIRITRDLTQDARDKYGRILANVHLPNGTLYAEKAASAGTAFHYVYEKRPTSFDVRIKKAEASAKAKSLGVWSACGGVRKSVSAPTSADVPKSVAPSPAAIAAPSAVTNASGFSCSVSKNACADMSSCEEAKFYLNVCGLGKFDRDKDGVPCETICK